MKPQLHNPSAGEILREEFLIPKCISQNKLALTIGCTRSFITHIMKNRRKISVKFDKKLADFFGVSEGFFFGIQNDWLKEEQKND